MAILDEPRTIFRVAGNRGTALKVLLLAWNYPPALGGIEYVAWYLARGLRKSGDAVRVVARHDPTKVREGGEDVHRPNRPGLAAYQWHALVTAWSLLREDPADIIVCPGIVDAPVAWLLGGYFRIPFVVLAHGSDVRHGGTVYRTGMSFLFRRAQGVAANSGSTRDLLAGIGCDVNRLRIIHPGVNVDAYPLRTQSQRTALRVTHGVDDRLVLLTVGRLIRRKGVLDFVDNVLPALVRTLPEVLYLVVGDDARESLVHKEPMSGRIRSLVARRGLEQNVRLMGAVDDVTLRELHAAADVHVLPAVDLPGDVEGFGIVLLEAALSRTPIVATATGGIPEAVGDEGAGLLVQPGDWDGMTRGILDLLHDPVRRERMSQAGRERVLSRFDWPEIVAEYRSFFEEVSAKFRNVKF